VLSYATEMSGQAASCVKSDGVKRKEMFGTSSEPNCVKILCTLDGELIYSFFFFFF
jgi:hypothetical protein